MMHPTNPDAVRVKREGGRGWHWVASFDPAIHERFDDAPEPAEHVHVPADYEVDGLEPPSKRRAPARRKK